MPFSVCSPFFGTVSPVSYGQRLENNMKKEEVQMFIGSKYSKQRMFHHEDCRFAKRTKEENRHALVEILLPRTPARK